MPRSLAMGSALTKFTRELSARSSTPATAEFRKSVVFMPAMRPV
jgi:hypothetical protein